MEDRKQEDLEWLMARNPPPLSSPNAFRTLPMPENPRNLYLPSPYRNHVNRLSSLPESRAFRLPMHDINNPYHTNIALQDGANPNFADSLYDLEAEFDQLNISSNPNPNPIQSAAAAAPYGGRVGSMPAYAVRTPAQFPVSYPATAYGNNVDLQRMRVESAVRGQLGRSDDQVWNSDLRGLILNNVIHDQDLDILRRQELVLANRNESGIYPDLGYAFPNNSSGNKVHNFQQRQQRSLDGLVNYDNPSLTTSVYSRFRQRGQNLSSLEELKNKMFSSLEELRGKIFVLAKDQNGARDLQKILGEGKPEEREIIFSELKDHVRELMVDQFANYLAQKMFEVANAQQITELLLLVINDERSLVVICLDMHGTRAMQKLLGHLTTPEQRSLVISALRRITVTLTKSTNGHHVVEHCLKYFPNEDKKYILDVVAENCLDIAMDKSGCCVLQQCVEHSRGEPRDRLFAEISANALVLSEHPYGNYVVQYILALRIPHITSVILAQLAGNFVSLSMNKHGSNVVEKCIKDSSDEQARCVIREIIESRDVVAVLQDPFGNYVAQSAYVTAKGSTRNAMLNVLQMHYTSLHSHPHGKRVLARARGSRQRA